MLPGWLSVPLIKKMYKTSLGYKNNDMGVGPTPDEAFQFGSNGFVHGVRELLWNTNEHHSDELEQRLIGSVAPTWKITPWLTAKVRVATDYTTSKTTNTSNSAFPSAASSNSSSGGYSTLSKSYQVLYGDAMLMFDKDITDKIGLTAHNGLITEEVVGTSYEELCLLLESHSLEHLVDIVGAELWLGICCHSE